MYMCIYVCIHIYTCIYIYIYTPYARPKLFSPLRCVGRLRRRLRRPPSGWVALRKAKLPEAPLKSQGRKPVEKFLA